MSSIILQNRSNGTTKKFIYRCNSPVINSNSWNIRENSCLFYPWYIIRLQFLLVRRLPFDEMILFLTILSESFRHFAISWNITMMLAILFLLKKIVGSKKISAASSLYLPFGKKISFSNKLRYFEYLSLWASIWKSISQEFQKRCSNLLLINENDLFISNRNFH